ncbi:hypothetical protein QQS21_004005 [Conoideocrella luteorostrata]|uniref:Uncharacterized protein n=1 Tax=Conoideocrella luteorostrata TaxID=1105319 RepID=A0AAJ0CSD0_9HYPO|nr:hypothetical protein QQS21_004005 [Conoideocrella luteorostrata]
MDIVAGIKIAYLDYNKWQFLDSVYDKTLAFDVEHVSRVSPINEPDAYTLQKSAINEAMKKVESLAAKVTFNAPLMSIDDVTSTYSTVTQG